MFGKLLILALAGLLMAPGAHSRHLRGAALSSATSTGGVAISSSTAQGNSTVGATAVASDRGTAIAQQAASDGSHHQTVVAVGGTIHTAQQDSPSASTTWESAPACPSKPTAATSIKDKQGRLWGWAGNRSCAYKLPVYQAGPSWDSAAACPPSMSPATGVKDQSGRVWGWHHNVSCAFKPTGRKLLQADLQTSDTSASQGVTVSSSGPIPADQPAALGSTSIVKTLTGSGDKAVECHLVTVQDPTDQSEHSEMKCGPASNAAPTSTPIGISSADNAVNTPAATSTTTTTAGNASAMLPPLPGMGAHDDAQDPTSSALNTTDDTAPTTDAALGAPFNSNSNTTPEALPINDTPGNSIAVPTAPLPAASGAAEVLTTVNRFGVEWRAAPVCVGKPNKRTAVQDTLGRLWWFESNMSCAYRNSQGSPIYYDGYAQVKWADSPACRGAPTLVNSMADAEQRLWGWEEADGANCKFDDAAGKAIKQEHLLQAVIQVAAAESTELRA